MTMILLDVFYKTPEEANSKPGRVIDNPTFIPRIGERVNMGYDPATVITDVVYDFEHNVVYVSGGLV